MPLPVLALIDKRELVIHVGEKRSSLWLLAFSFECVDVFAHKHQELIQRDGISDVEPSEALDLSQEVVEEPVLAAECSFQRPHQL